MHLNLLCSKGSSMYFSKMKLCLCASLIVICFFGLLLEGLVPSAAYANSRVEVVNFGCTGLLMKFKKEHQTKKYAAFAKGRAFTITGMLGCGASWNKKSQAHADKDAMDRCRKRARNPDKCYISHRTK